MLPLTKDNFREFRSFLKGIWISYPLDSLFNFRGGNMGSKSEAQFPSFLILILPYFILLRKGENVRKSGYEKVEKGFYEQRIWHLLGTGNL